jgi:hypothetical protein
MPTHVALLSTLCTAVVCCAGAVQLAGMGRLEATDRDVRSAISTVAERSQAAGVSLRFKSETFPLER